MVGMNLKILQLQKSVACSGSNPQTDRQTDRQKSVPSSSLSRNVPVVKKASACSGMSVQKREYCRGMKETCPCLSLHDRCLIKSFP